jgi:hypothetical protein
MEQRPHRIALTALSAGVCIALTGCLSYTSKESSTPAVEVPSTSTTTTTTTSENDGTVQKEHSTTTTIP